MFKDFIQSIYEKVYIINFDKCSQIPCLTNEELKNLGKWYVSTGKEWICHSDYELEEFKNIFLNFMVQRKIKRIPPHCLVGSKGV